MTSIKGTFEPRVVNNKGGEGEGEGEEWVMAYSTREQEKYGSTTNGCVTMYLK